MLKVKSIHISILLIFIVSSNSAFASCHKIKHVKIIIILTVLNGFVYSQSGSWTQLNPPISPPVRISSVMSRISVNEVIFFGGTIGNSSYNDETWIFNKSTGLWVELATPI